MCIKSLCHAVMTEAHRVRLNSVAHHCEYSCKDCGAKINKMKKAFRNSDLIP